MKREQFREYLFLDGPCLSNPRYPEEVVCRLEIPAETITVYERSNADQQDSNRTARPTSMRLTIRYITCSVGSIARQIDFPSGRRQNITKRPSSRASAARAGFARRKANIRSLALVSWPATEELPPRHLSLQANIQQFNSALEGRAVFVSQ